MLAGGLHPVEPLVEVKIGVLGEHRAPFTEVIVADGPLPLFVSDNGEDEVQIGVCERIILATGMAFPAGVRVRTVGAIQIAGVSEGQRKGAAACASAKEAGMGDDASACCVRKARLEVILPDNVVEIHRVN